MGSTGYIFQNTLSSSLYSTKCYKNGTLARSPSQFLSSNSVLRLKKRTLYSPIQLKQLKNKNIHVSPIIYAAQSNFLKVIQTAWQVGKDGIDAGTSLVPDAIPRPIARISVAIVAVTLSLFVLKSFISTVFFALAVMGLCYFVFIALNKDEAPKGDGGATSVDDSLEEARRIMDKYK